MKKYFIFAAIAAAGLLTSCSSSDDAITDVPNGPTYGENDQVPIILGASARADVDVTKGTGTVGDLASNTATNVWGGQHVWVYMMERGTITPAKASENDATGIYENTEMRTPNPSEGVTGVARELVAVENDGMYQQRRYYPLTGNYDFWAYHIDDAGTEMTTGDNPVPTGKPVPAPAENVQLGEGNNAVTADVIQVPFKIDGSQDLMVAHAWPTEAELSTLGHTDFYSAKAARADLQPNLTFEHLLTRLQFVIKAGNKKTCGWVNLNDGNEENDAFAAVGTNYTGVFVQGIKVISKESGKIVAAYTRSNDALTTEPGLEKDDLISYDATAAYPSKEDVVGNEFQMPANYDWFTVKGTHEQASFDYTYNWTATDADAWNAEGATKVDKSDEVIANPANTDAGLGVKANYGKVYRYWISGEVNNKTYAYYTVEAGDPTIKTPGAVTKLPALYDPDDYNYDNIEVPAELHWATITAEAYGDTEDDTHILVAGDAATTVDAAETTYKLEANIGKSYKIWTSGDAGNKVYSYRKVTQTPAYTTNLWKNALVISNDAAAPFSGIIRPTWNATTGADEVSVGSALLVSDENTYVMQIDLAQLLLDKSTINANDENLEGDEVAGAGPDKYILKTFQLTKDFHLSGENPADFEKGTSYKVLITVYGAEEIQVKATLTGWAPGEDVPVVLE